jgi:hypothetical protein
MKYRRLPALTAIVIPSGVRTLPQRAFADCKNCNRFSAAGLQEIEYEAFRNCRSLASITLPQTVHTIAGNCLQTAVRSLPSACRTTSPVSLPAPLPVAGAARVFVPEKVEFIDETAFDRCEQRAGYCGRQRLNRRNFARAMALR